MGERDARRDPLHPVRAATGPDSQGTRGVDGMATEMRMKLTDANGQYIPASEEELAAARAYIGQAAFNRVFEILYKHRVKQLAAEAEKESAA